VQSIKASIVVSVESSTDWQDEFVVLFRLVKGEKPANELNEEASSGRNVWPELFKLFREVVVDYIVLTSDEEGVYLMWFM
jgi:hypothetical protein